MKRNKYIIGIILFALILPCGFAQDFKTGLDAYLELDYRRARDVWEIEAENGDTQSQLWMGVLYVLGKGVPVNYATAYFWFRLAEKDYPREAKTLLDLITPKMSLEAVQRAQEKADHWSPVFGESNGLIAEAFAGDPIAADRLGSLYLYGPTQESYRSAAGWLKRAAAHGDSIAAFKLGFLYDIGWGVVEDDSKALYWYQQAAVKGVEDALVMLGTILYDGHGVEHNKELATRILKKAASRGNTTAQLILGEMLTNVGGVPENTRDGLKWLIMAASQGDADAQNLLGILYLTGHGIDRDPARAVEWFEKAAALGHAEAQYNLGMLYQINKGTPSNLSMAAKWYLKAARQGVQEAHLALAEIYLCGYQVRDDCVNAYYWAILAAAGEDEKVREEARYIIEALQAAMPLTDILGAQNHALEYWKSIR